MPAPAPDIAHRDVHPRVSLILCVKNGMPYLPEAITSVAAQTFRDFELVVQDGGSTDGTLEFLREVDDLPALDIVSASDSGIGQAYNRALQRCAGDLIGSIDSDNLLAPDALAAVVEAVDQYPDAAAVYGASDIIDADGTTLRTFVPEPFDLLRVIACEVVPPFATSFFLRENCGPLLRFEEDLKTCADYDLWLRLAHLPIHRAEAVLGSTRLSGQSMTRDAGRYDQFCHDKKLALRHYLRSGGTAIVQKQVAKRAEAGIFLWAAESVLELEGPSPRFRDLCRRAEATHGDPARLERVIVAAQPPPPPPPSPPAEPVVVESEMVEDRVPALEARLEAADAAVAEARTSHAELTHRLEDAAAVRQKLEEELQATTAALEELAATVAWMRETRVWRLGTLYWRMNARVRRSFSWFSRH